LALSPPDHDPNVLAHPEVGQDLEETSVHLVVEGVVLLGVVVGDRGDGPVDVETDSLLHRSDLRRAAQQAPYPRAVMNDPLLDADRLLSHAHEATGLDDLGRDTWTQGL